MWIVFIVVMISCALFEVAQFALNKHFSGKASFSATNTEIAGVTVLTWWYTTIDEGADEIRRWQEEVLKFKSIITILECSPIRTIDTKHKMRLTYFCSAYKEI